MRRRIAVLTIVLCLLLTACGSGDGGIQQALKFRSDLLGAGGCRFAADVSADYGERVYAFSLACDCPTGAAASIKVTKPAAIEDICATVSSANATLDFDATALDFGQMANGHLAPLAAPWLLADSWSGAYIAECGRDDKSDFAVYKFDYDEKELTVYTWFTESGDPTYAEVSYEGERLLAITITDFSFYT